MSGYGELLRRHALACAPGDAAQERVLRRVAASFGRPAALDGAPVGPRGAESRILARLDARKQPRRWLPGAGSSLAAGLLAAALLLLLRPAPTPPLDRELSGVAHVELSPEVRLDTDGTGSVTGTRFQPALTWQIGRLHVEVEPQQGVALSVETREARVEVVGTGFTVVRDARGTVVAVDHGRVRVTCAGSDAVLLGEAERAECRPVSAAGLLARAQAERADGVEPATILSDVRAGLTTVGPEAVHQELRALLVPLLIETGEREEAARVADDYLRRGGPRQDELQGMIAGAAGP